MGSKEIRLRCAVQNDGLMTKRLDKIVGKIRGRRVVVGCGRSQGWRRVVCRAVRKTVIENVFLCSIFRNHLKQVLRKVLNKIQYDK